jgi:hypothetical protein
MLDRMADMAPTKMTGLRIPASLLERVDAYAAMRNEREPGLGMTRAGALRILVERGLSAESEASARKRKK